MSTMRCRFGECAAATGEGQADLITMVAVLHHLDLGDPLARIPWLLVPGAAARRRPCQGGLAADVMVDLMSFAANPVMGLIKYPRLSRPADGSAAGQPVMPVRDPSATAAEIAVAASTRLPGATLRRLFFRYTLRWDKSP